jgi:hypothetical protein
MLTGKHLRVPARNRILDDECMAALGRLGGAPAQVVNIGCGMVGGVSDHLLHVLLAGACIGSDFADIAGHS